MCRPGVRGELNGRTATDTPGDRHAAAFEQHGPVLLGAAYRILGTVQDSEDAVQETWLRWAEVDLDGVRDARSYPLRAVTRNALNVARTQQRRREEYPGPWLPEPVSTDAGGRPDRVAEITDEVSLTLLVVLESLSPLEHAAFVLREVFDTPYPEVAQTLGRSEASVRQLVSRAHSYVSERAPRNPVDTRTHLTLIERFLAAARGTTPLSDLLSVLAPDVVLTTDAGGRAKAALRPVVGVEKVLRFVAAILAKPEVAALEWSLGQVNGGPALLGLDGERVDAVVWIESDGGVVRSPTSTWSAIPRSSV